MSRLSSVGRLVSTEDAPGEPVTAAGVTVTPWSRATVVRLPFARLVWNRPLAVDVTRDGRTERRSIGSPALVRWLLLLAGLVGRLLVSTEVAFRRHRP
jgi:hypothetical protein